MFIGDSHEFGLFDGHVAFVELVAEGRESGGTGLEGHVGMCDGALQGLELGGHLVHYGVFGDLGGGAMTES